MKDNMRAVLDDVQDGTFARPVIADRDNGALEFKTPRGEEGSHPIEKTDKFLRVKFAWTQ